MNTWGAYAGWIALIVGVLAWIRLESVRRWTARELRERDVQRQRDLLQLAERLEPHGPSSDGLPPRISQKFQRKFQ